MENGAIWVFSGLIDATTDDELAIVLGHELAHYTHEHSRRGAKRNMFGQLIAAVADEALTSINSETARQTAELAAALSLSAWTTGYNRELEDQADRVGLRYVHEAGYNVSVGPSLWARFRDKYGEMDKVSSFFVGTHSRPSDRMRNLERELAWNYAKR